MKGRGTLILLAILICLCGYLYFMEIKGRERKQTSEENARKLLSLDEDNIDRMTLLRPQEKMVFEKRESDWHLLEPIHTKGDGSTMDNLISELTRAKAERIVDTDEEMSNFGLDPAKYTIIVESNKKSRMDTLHFGEKNPTDRFLFVLSSKLSGLILTGTTIQSYLKKNVFDYRDKSILDFEKENVIGIQLIRRGMENIQITRETEDWHVVSPIQTKADQSAVDAIVNQLSNGKVQEFIVEESKNLRTYGLENPDAAVIINEGSEPNQKKLIIGSIHDDNHIFAKDINRDPIFTVDSTIVKEIKKTLFDLRDKTVAVFERDSVYYIEINYTDTLTISFRRDDADEWWLESPQDAKAKKWKVTGLLSDIEYLKVKAFIGQKLSEKQQFGFTKPRLNVRLKNKNEKEIVHLKIGSLTDEDRVYTMNVLTGWIYLTDEEIIDDLTFQMDEIQETNSSEN